MHRAGCRASAWTAGTKSRQDGERDTVSQWEFMQHECCRTSQGSGFGGLLRARKAPLDLLGKWVCEEPWEISAVLLAKQTHCLASWPDRTTAASIVLGKGFCPLSSPAEIPGMSQQFRTVQRSSKNILLTLQSPGAAEKLISLLLGSGSTGSCS